MISLYIFLVFLFTLQASADLLSEHSYFAALDEDQNVKLYWNVSTENKEISFTVEAKTTGWVGFGISSGQGKMKGADIVIGWVKDGKAYFKVSSVRTRLDFRRFLESGLRSSREGTAGRVSVRAVTAKFKLCSASGRQNKSHHWYFSLNFLPKHLSSEKGMSFTHFTYDQVIVTAQHIKHSCNYVIYIRYRNTRKSTLLNASTRLFRGERGLISRTAAGYRVLLFSQKLYVNSALFQITKSGISNTTHATGRQLWV